MRILGARFVRHLTIAAGDLSKGPRLLSFDEFLIVEIRTNPKACRLLQDRQLYGDLVLAVGTRAVEQDDGAVVELLGSQDSYTRRPLLRCSEVVFRLWGRRARLLPYASPTRSDPAKHGSGSTPAGRGVPDAQ